MKLMRVDRVQYGPLFLTDVAVTGLPKDRMTLFEERAGIPTAGLLSAEALMNYRVGLDYAHSTVYFDIGRTIKFPGFTLSASSFAQTTTTASPSSASPISTANPRSLTFKPAIISSPWMTSRPRLYPGTSLVFARRLPRPGTQADHRARRQTVHRRRQGAAFLGDAPGNDEAKGKSKKN